MNYRAKPVKVEAHVIVSVEPTDGYWTVLALDNGVNVRADASMTARYTPKSGDFWVIQNDGYIYINPRDVFLRKYEPIEEPL